MIDMTKRSGPVVPAHVSTFELALRRNDLDGLAGVLALALASKAS